MKFLSSFLLTGALLLFQNVYSTGSGKIKIYFNHPVNTSVSTGTDAIYLNQTLDDTLVAYINQAKYTIDVAVYNYVQTSDIANIAGAIDSAYSRGVTVRWIHDGSTSNTGLTGLNAGIQTLASPTTMSYGIMHNKFMIIDANSSNAADALVWTGSCNWTSQQFYHDVNNSIIIQDKQLAAAYTAEFNQMWGGTGASPNLSNSKFGPFKSDVITHSFTVDGKNIELYFSPYSQTNSHIINAVTGADKEIYFGIYAFTVGEIADSIVSKIQNNNIYSLGIMDNFSVHYTPYTILSPVMSSNLQVFNVSNYLYHSKMMIVDANYPSLDPLVITGSHNWSASADTKNDENALFVHDPTIANIYYQSFWQNFLDLDPTAEITALDNDKLNLQVYPNPSHGNFSISLHQLKDREINIELLNTLGEKVYETKSSPSENSSVININAQTLTSGIYLLKIQYGNHQGSKRLIVE